MKIRPFDHTDQAAARALIQAGMHERWGETYDEALNPDTDDIAGNYTTDGRQFFVGVDDAGLVVATGALVPAGRDTSRIFRMSVDGGRRREGLGRQMVEGLIDQARAVGSRRVLVSTDTPWESAIGLYAACGFEVIGIDPTDTHFGMDL